MYSLSGSTNSVNESSMINNLNFLRQMAQSSQEVAVANKQHIAELRRMEK